jgi:uncharacterized protein (TIGR02246 family)
MSTPRTRSARFSTLAIAGLLPAWSIVAAQAAPSVVPTADREALAALVHNWESAWNTHDMHAFGELFHEDGVWILWTGEVWKGRTAIEEGHAAVHKTYYRNSVQREQIEELTFLGPEAAVVRFASTLTGDERFPGKVIRSRKILVVTKRGGTWRVGWGQNTRLPPDPAP